MILCTGFTTYASLNIIIFTFVSVALYVNGITQYVLLYDLLSANNVFEVHEYYMCSSSLIFCKA